LARPRKTKPVKGLAIFPARSLKWHLRTPMGLTAISDQSDAPMRE